MVRIPPFLLKVLVKEADLHEMQIKGMEWAVLYQRIKGGSGHKDLLPATIFHGFLTLKSDGFRIIVSPIKPPGNFSNRLKTDKHGKKDKEKSSEKVC